jgi:hypothetical protein
MDRLKTPSKMRRIGSGNGRGIGYGTGSGSGMGSGSGGGGGGGQSAQIVNAPANVTSVTISSGVANVDASASERDAKPTIAQSTPEMLHTQRLKEKLHFWIYALVDRLQRNISTPTANEELFVKDGKAEVVITLAAKTPETLAALKALGFELVTEKGKTGVIGHIPVEKLAALTDIDTVKLVLPKM